MLLGAANGYRLDHRAVQRQAAEWRVRDAGDGCSGAERFVPREHEISFRKKLKQKRRLRGYTPPPRMGREETWGYKRGAGLSGAARGGGGGGLVEAA